MPKAIKQKYSNYYLVPSTGSQSQFSSQNFLYTKLSFPDSLPSANYISTGVPKRVSVGSGSGQLWQGGVLCHCHCLELLEHNSNKEQKTDQLLASFIIVFKVSMCNKYLILCTKDSLFLFHLCTIL